MPFRNPENLEPITLDCLKDICDRAKESRESCLFSLLYLSGRRLSEVLELQKKDILLNNSWITFYTFNAKNFRREQTSQYSILRGERFYERIRVTFTTESDTGKTLSPYILKHLDSIQPDDYLFHHRLSKKRHIGARSAELIMHSLEPKLWAHALRHLRFTQVAEAYQDDPLAMHSFTHHHSFASTERYLIGLKNRQRLTKV